MQSHTTYPWLLRRADQATVALLAFTALAAICGWISGSVEVDRTPRRTVQFQVDINTADLPELNQLPGIGDTLGQRIIESRQNEGPFVEKDELLRVRGIGPKIMERLRPYMLPISKINNVETEK